MFPYPRLDVQLNDGERLYLRGALAGGTWAVERDTWDDDLAIYRDLRVAVGIEHADEDGEWSALEIAFLFDRKLAYTSAVGDYRPNGTVMIRSVGSY